MREQRSFAGLAWTTKGKMTRRERFLAEMDQVIPWAQLIARIEPHYPKAGKGRRPLGLEKMLRIYFLQQWFDLSDPGAEDAIYDSESMRRFVGIELGEDKVPDETTILNFRHLLEKHELTKGIFDEVGALLKEKGLLLKQGTLVDASIISAPSSMKNRSGTRDPEMRQTKKGNQWYFGMKVHIGSDPQGLVHSLVTTDAAQADIKQLPDLIHGEEEEVFGDAAYRSEPDRRSFQSAKVRYRMNRRGRNKAPLSERAKRSTVSTPGCGREWSIRFTSSNGSGASTRSGIEGWPRTPPVPLLRSRWRTSTWSDENFSEPGRSVSGSGEIAASGAETRENAPSDRTVRPLKQTQPVEIGPSRR